MVFWVLIKSVIKSRNEFISISFIKNVAGTQPTKDLFYAEKKKLTKKEETGDLNRL